MWTCVHHLVRYPRLTLLSLLRLHFLCHEKKPIQVFSVFRDLCEKIYPTTASAPTQEGHASTSTVAPIPSAGDHIQSPPDLATAPIENHFPSTSLKSHRLAHYLRITQIKTLFSPSCTTFPSGVRLASMVQGFPLSHLTSPPPSNTKIYLGKDCTEHVTEATWLDHYLYSSLSLL